MAMALPPRRNSPDLLDRFKLIDFLVGQEYIVQVTHVNHPQSVYVRHISYKYEMDFLHLHGDHINPEEIEIGQRVIYQSRRLNLRYIRGDIKSKKLIGEEKETVCTIFAPDFGFIDIDVIADCIFSPASTLALDCPPLAVHCLVDQCYPKEETFTDFTIQTMKEFLGRQPAEITVVTKRDDKLAVILRPVKCTVTDVALWLAFLKLTKLSDGPDSAPNVGEVFHFKEKELKVGDRLSVRVQSGHTIEKFFVAELKDYQKYHGDLKLFADHCKEQPAVDIDAAIDGICCCGIKMPNTNDRYERAIVLRKSAPGKAMTKLVDWGTEVEVPYEDIKYTPTEAYNILPAMAICCASTIDQIWGKDLAEFLRPGHQFMIEIVELAEGADVPHLVNVSPIPDE